VSEDITNSSATLQLAQLRTQFQKLEEAYSAVLPKVDRALLFDFLNLEKIAKGESLPYTIEVFTKEGVNTDQAKEYIYAKTGMMPAISDRGTHYITNQILTLEMLKEINDSDDVVEITGSYTGALAWHSVRHGD
jgi:hypothetical protein